MNNINLFEQIKNDIQKHKLLFPDAKIIIGVSGGADSVCLLKVLLEYKNYFDLQLLVIHVNHRLRGHEADKDQAYVMELCRDWGIESRAYGVDIRAVSRKLGISEEEAGRNARYKIFNKVLEKSNFDYIAVAHNRDDQAETVMLNILRGAGLDGLCGMSIKQGRIIRPLLNISRKEIEKYLGDNNIQYCIDSSNLSGEYTRNRVRNKLFPTIKELFDVDPVNQLYKLSTLVSDERDYLEDEAKRIYADIVLPESELIKDEIIISASSLRTFSNAIAKRIIRLAWERINNSRKNLEAVHVDQIISLCHNNRTGKKVQLPNGIEAILSYDRLVFLKGGKKNCKPFSYTVLKDGLASVNEVNGILESRVLSRDEFLKLGNNENVKENAFTQFFDLDALKGEIKVRSRLEGDRIRPYKAKGEKKIKDYFIDQKISREKRDLIPLVAQGNKIIWIVGMRTSEEFRARKDTKNIWMLSWCYLDNGGVKNA